MMQGRIAFTHLARHWYDKRALLGEIVAVVRVKGNRADTPVIDTGRHGVRRKARLRRVNRCDTA